MKTQKRSHSDKAYAKGYQTGVAGKSMSNCPHISGEARQNWMTGWREGREDHWNGFNTQAQVQRISNF